MPKTSKESRGELLPLPTKKKIDLHNLTAIRREMNSVYRDARNGAIEDAQGTKFIYMLNAIAKTYESEVLETDLKQIKNTLKIRESEQKAHDK